MSCRAILKCVFGLGLVAAQAGADWVARPGTVKLYVRKGMFRNAEGILRPVAIPHEVLDRLQAELVDEQDTFALLQLPSASASPTVLGGMADLVETRDDFDILQFRSLPIDVREPPQSYPLDWWRDVARPYPERDAFVIQFAAPPHPVWLAELRAAGIAIRDYIPQNGYTVLADSETLDSIVLRLPIQLARLHQPFHKVSNTVRQASASFVDLEISIAEVPEAEEAKALLTQTALAALRPPEQLGDRTVYRLTLVLSVVREIARMPAVLWIDTYQPPAPSGQREVHLSLGSTLSSEASGVLKPVLADHRQWINVKGLGGYKTALKMAILDTGFDIGSSTDVHPDFRASSGSSFVQVVRYTNAAGSDADCAGHGTMV